MVSSVPVGRRLHHYNRRVTFVNLLPNARTEGKEEGKEGEGKEGERKQGEGERREEVRPASKGKLLQKTSSVSQAEEGSNTAKTMPDLRSL